MKFRFCGDLDCPDWLLAEISILSKLSSIRVKQLCSEVVKSLLGSDINYEQVEKSAKSLEESDIKAAIAALSFILSSAAKHSVDDSSLDNELQQLGLPKENVGALCKVYAENLRKLQDAFRSRSLRTSKLESVDWRVDCMLSSSSLQDICEPRIYLKLARQDPVTGVVTPLSFTVSGETFRLLLRDLKQASASMENLS